MATYIVVPAAQNPPIREALGRLNSARLGLPWPIPAKFADGSIDPDLTHASFYCVDGKPSVDGTQFGFPVDADVALLLGQTALNTSFGDITIPTETQDLAPEWFWVPDER